MDYTRLAVPFPWQQQQWQQMLAQAESQRLPHALLVQGPEGGGKQNFVAAAAQYLLCPHAAERQLACGECKSCQLVVAGTHPDLVIIEPDGPGKAIKIDQIRSLVEFVEKTAQMGGYRVVIVHPAEAMNVAAANALLKSLEEPGVKTQFFVISHMPSRLMPTIRSRCQAVNIALPETSLALDWLKSTLPEATDAQKLLNAASGAPLLAAELMESDWLESREKASQELLGIKLGKTSPLSVAGQWKDGPVLQLVEWWGAMLIDLAKCHSGLDAGSYRNSDLAPVLQQLQKLTSEQNLFAFHDRLHGARQLLLSGSNPNAQLLLEDLLIGWSKV